MVHTKSKYRMFRPLVFIAICTVLFSFAAKMGADSFEIYLNHQLVFQQYVSGQQEVKYLQLDQSLNKAEVIVYYSHCGKTGTNRNISIRDQKGQVLKEWHFPDSDGKNKAMPCKVSDILALQKKEEKIPLSLYYSSRELPGGRQLASLVFADNKQTAKNDK